MDADPAIAVDWLLASDEPAIRYRTRTWLLDQGEDEPEVARDRAQILEGAIVSTLLTFPDASLDIYRKWQGLHWRLVSLAEFEPPIEDPHMRTRLDDALDRELDWRGIPRTPRSVDGLYRIHASMGGNALYAASRLGYADDRRAAELSADLQRWQWPDGGWNCDSKASGYRSSFHESWATAMGLAAFADATGRREARQAARRTAELLLEHRMIRTLAGDEVVHPRWEKLHWPAYWHYDLLAGLRVLQTVDPALLRDPRAAGALDLLEAKALPDGRFQAERRWWRTPDGATSAVDPVDWGYGEPSEALTLHALRVLKVAGRWTAV